MIPANLFTDATPPSTGERFETIASCRNVVIKRIVSSATPDSTEYVQAEDEWVVLLRGEATLEIEGRAVELREGNYVLLPARTPHVVRRTTAGAIWLAVHLH